VVVQPTQITQLNQKPPKGGNYVLYWMQASQREEYNHALEYAIGKANEIGKPLVCLFALTSGYPGANRRHYAFMLEGLVQTKAALAKRGIQIVVKLGNPPEVVKKMAKGACLVIVDCGYTRIQRRWRIAAAEIIDCPLIQVESDIIVPVAVVSQKEEYSAATIRPKINRLLKEYLIPLKRTPLKIDSLGIKFYSLKLDNIDGLLNRVDIDNSVALSNYYRGGLSEAKKRLNIFLNHKLSDYARDKNDSAKNGLSDLSPYLHFGQISPLYIALKTIKQGGNKSAVFLEELIIRRELAINFVYYNNLYDNYEGLPNWCRDTLEMHADDKRPFIYTMAELELANTHDPYWNAAQTEMMITGKMHGYMRMYWGKKILEWSRSPQEAYATAIYLNDKYEIDGRDPNGYAGVAWCFGKHDRPWGSRPIFGNIRYMNDKGLKRKFDIDGYVKKIEKLKEKSF
jgi:deoxyribodipyrimidine photo-lyase